MIVYGPSINIDAAVRNVSTSQTSDQLTPENIAFLESLGKKVIRVTVENGKVSVSHGTSSHRRISRQR